MKMLNAAECNAVSGAGDMAMSPEGSFGNEFLDFMVCFKELHLNPTKIFVNGTHVDFSGVFREWCSANNINAETTAAENGWKL